MKNILTSLLQTATLFAIALVCSAPAFAFPICTVNTTSVNFGAYDIGSAATLDSTGSITLQCTESTPVTVTIGPSLVSGALVPRSMNLVSGSDALNYNLYTDAGHSSIWGDGTQGTATVVSSVTAGIPRNETIYGTAPAGQNVAVGSYSDTLTVTIMW